MKFFFRRILLSLVLLFFVTGAAFSIDLALKVEPMTLAPFLSSGEKKWDPIGGGAFLNVGVDLLGLLDLGLCGGYFIVPKNNNGELLEDEAKFVSLIPLGLQSNIFFYPAARLETSFGLSFGYGIAQNGSMSHFAPWYRGFADFGFRFNPRWTLALSTSYFAYQNDSWFGNPGIAGLMTGLSVKYHLETKRKSGGAGTVECSVDIPDSIFPLFYTMYKENPIGNITIKNSETAEIRNVVISFRAQGYTASEIECGRIPQIRKHQSKEIQLLADFSKEILKFTEAGKIPGEIVVDYEILGEKKTSVSSVVIPVYNRNQMRWSDPQSIAAYISASAPDVLEFSKVVVGLARGHLRSGLNRNLQFAIFVFEGMRSAGIKCEENFETPYAKFYRDDSLLDYIQYPYQTMFYKSGDKDEIGILLMALLESVGISVSYIPLEDDFIVLFNTGISPERAERFFNDDEHIFTFDDSVWIPLSMGALREGFVNSWLSAANLMNRLILEASVDLPLINLEEAWVVYPSAGFTSNENISLNIDSKKLVSTVGVELSRYISNEFGPRINELKNQIVTEGGTADNYNQLGMMYIRAGMYNEAADAYKNAAALGSVNAMINIGNIALLQKQYLEAKAWYEKALSIDPDNATASKNLERVLGELE